jgi:hypothetical protein
MNREQFTTKVTKVTEEKLHRTSEATPRGGTRRLQAHRGGAPSHEPAPRTSDTVCDPVFVRFVNFVVVLAQLHGSYWFLVDLLTGP